MKQFKKFLIIIPILFGVIIFVLMKINKNPPVRLDDAERVQSVRVIPLKKMEVVPRIISYGYAVPDKSWQAISEVSGKIVNVHPNLKKGYFIKEGEILFNIDTTTYGIAETKGVAEVMNINARLKELEQTQKNTQRLLATEKKSLISAGQELKRKRELFAKNYISASDLEKEERNFLSHQTAVNNLQNALDLIPSQKKALLAQKKSGEFTVTERRLDVAKTQIRAPFNCRLSAVNIELSQFAAAGTILVEAESIDRAEIPVFLTPKDFFMLLPKDYSENFGKMPDMETIRRAIGISAKVRLPLDREMSVEWDGSFSRTSESLDLKTGAITIYITVDDPYAKAIPGKRPPLVTNMYVEVELRGRPMANRFVVPRSAIHEKTIYICTPENRLEIRPVGIDFYMQDAAVLSKGVQQGESLVLADLVPAISGMGLNPIPAPEVIERLKAEAVGKGEAQ